MAAGEPVLDAQLFNYGAFDPEPRGSYASFDGPEYNLTIDEMADFWVNYLPPNRSIIRWRGHCSPPYGMPPTLLASPNASIFSDGMGDGEGAGGCAGVDITAKGYDGATHHAPQAVRSSRRACRPGAGGSVDWLSGE